VCRCAARTRLTLGCLTSSCLTSGGTGLGKTSSQQSGKEQATNEEPAPAAGKGLEVAEESRAVLLAQVVPDSFNLPGEPVAQVGEPAQVVLAELTAAGLERPRYAADLFCELHLALAERAAGLFTKTASHLLRLVSCFVDDFVAASARVFSYLLGCTFGVADAFRRVGLGARAGT